MASDRSVLDKELKQVAQNVDAKEGESFRLIQVKVGSVHVGLRHLEKFTEDETGLIDGAHPSVEMVGGERDLEMVFVLGVGREVGQVARDGFAGGFKQVPKFGRNEPLPVAVGFGLCIGRIGEKALAHFGGVALTEDLGKALQAVQKHGVHAAKAEPIDAVGFDAKMSHWDLSRRARS